MSDLLSRLQADLNASRKAQEKERTVVLSSTISEAKNREIELKRALTDDDILEVIRKGIKKRKESAELYRRGNRSDLADKEEAEIRSLEPYLPAAVDPAEIRAAVVAAIEAGANNIGAVMGKVVPMFKGRAEGSAINAIAREEIAKRG
jgi:uncharacterized protein